MAGPEEKGTNKKFKDTFNLNLGNVEEEVQIAVDNQANEARRAGNASGFSSHELWPKTDKLFC